MNDAPEWAELFERTRGRSTSVEVVQDVRERLQSVEDAGPAADDESTSTGSVEDDGSAPRGHAGDGSTPTEPAGDGTSVPTESGDESASAGSSQPDVSEPSEPDPARLVADADVLVADLLVGGPARDALDHARRHDWVELVASDELLDIAGAVVAELAEGDAIEGSGGASLAADWRARIERERTAVTQPPADHPALASAYRGGAAHLLSFDGTLTSAATNRSLRPYTDLSIRSPDAFASLFDPESLYEHLHDGAYPGPDRRR